MTLLASIHDWPVEHVAAAAVLADGSIELEGDVDSAFPLASVTKLLTAVAALVATEDGSIHLDDAAGPAGSTVRHLLAHASGLAFDAHDVASRPGTRRIYSSTGYEVLARTVEQAIDMPFAAFVREAVLEPLAMDATTFDGSPAAGARGTVRDLVRFATEVMSPQPRIIARATFETATSVAFPGLSGVLPGFGHQDPNDWGLGFEIRTRKSPHWTPPEASPRTVGHFGESGSLFWIDPTRRVALIVLGDRSFGSWAPSRWHALGSHVLGQS